MGAKLKVGSACSGYDGITLGLLLAGWDVETAWFAENDPDASAVLTYRWPDVPNHGDITKVDWAAVEPVDIFTAGFPCQPVSLAGRRKGTEDGRWLWDDIAAALGRMVTRPRLCLFENVPGLLSANGGDAMARVVHGLAALGYVGRYRVVGADDVRAPHRRRRVFIAAQLADPARHGHRDAWAPCGRGVPAAAVAGGAGRDGLSLLPTPAARLGDGRSMPGRELAARRMWDEGRRNLEDAVALLPTPTALDARGSRNATANRRDPKPTTHINGWTLSDVAYADRWGEYAPAIARWGQAVGRPAPEPTELGSNGAHRLSPRFVEWMIGLPEGHVTDPAIWLRQAAHRKPRSARNAMLRILGNGVVPQQMALAIELLAWSETQARMAV